MPPILCLSGPFGRWSPHGPGEQQVHGGGDDPAGDPGDIRAAEPGDQRAGVVRLGDERLAAITISAHVPQAWPTALTGSSVGASAVTYAPMAQAKIVAVTCFLLPLVEAGQQAERALEYLRCDKAGGQALFDLQANQHRLPDGPGLDGRHPRGGGAALAAPGVG
jgi:hypothetical protein